MYLVHPLNTSAHHKNWALDVSMRLVMYCNIFDQGVVKAINVNKLTAAGCTVKIWIADWFAQLNNKMGGDLKKIQTVGRYLVEIWKAVGMNLDKVEFLWSSDEINGRAGEYWPLVMDIARRNTLHRIIRFIILLYALFFSASLEEVVVFIINFQDFSNENGVMTWLKFFFLSAVPCVNL